MSREVEKDDERSPDFSLLSATYVLLFALAAAFITGASVVKGDLQWIPWAIGTVGFGAVAAIAFYKRGRDWRWFANRRAARAERRASRLRNVLSNTTDPVREGK